MQVVEKVFAYITSGDRLLVFRHRFAPEAGIQVPAGTIKATECPEEAVLREAFEETGLTDLTVARFLGACQRDMSEFGRQEVHHRRFYHLRCGSEPPVSWRYHETHLSDGPCLEPIVFDFFWVQLPDGVPPLIADHGQLIPVLLDNLHE